jgi:hypothetical protein
MKPSAWAARAAARTSASVASGRPKAMLDRTVSENRKLSSNTTPSAARSDPVRSVRTSRPPIRTAPAEAS